jgi:hypothetical protein
MRPVKLDLPLTAFERLHEKVDGRGEFTRINKEALRRLLSDHAKVIAALQDLGVPTDERYEDSSKVRKARTG